ncbi:cytochrome c oxidase assembly protein [Rickettsiales endosymbiont of Stachyamoeba lipophora]|uniref:cytochrome c oxidase assembly protein n=1 Tax=Rickettsiales endosymbiont of Stachyamoeba lipophora TaxID=2486578 RepID=UPI000F650F48|nr:cytochrome c oxidase assembly protein [Rickettsiales endosymbiont of Stachyamoeba lipophora]AZL15810.1 cytochrome c oxidase assembly protein [Rickettsiales endosymbiont of Stachyamoeba lipophora]
MHKSSNNKILVNLLAVTFGMLLLSFATVPLYKIFCQVTGYGGTVREVFTSSDKIGTKTLRVYFDANASPSLPWRFKNEQPYITVTTGENALAFYSAENLSSNPVKAMATYNVTPQKAGKYFQKISCFCFEEQMLLGKQHVNLPVSFYIDPKIEEDPNLKEVDRITLSYTFFNISEFN